MAQQSWDRIRPVALALIHRSDEILVGCHDTGENSFYRPLGGGIEVGEYARNAIVREIREELGRAIEPIRRRAVIENVFTYRGKQGHEVVFLIESAFSDDAAYDQETFVAEDEEATRARWMPVQSFIRGEEIVYPTGIADLLGKA